MTSGAGSRLVALVNPAWKSPSDFGLFKAGEAKEVLSEFDVTYSLQSLVVYGYTVIRWNLTVSPLRLPPVLFSTAHPWLAGVASHRTAKKCR